MYFFRDGSSVNCVSGRNVRFYINTLQNYKSYKLNYTFIPDKLSTLGLCSAYASLLSKVLDLPTRFQ